MSIDQAYAGAKDPDITQLEADGVIYRLMAWSTGNTVRARCYAIHEQGQETLLFDNEVAADVVAHSFDSVRCVHAADRYLVVLWLDRDDVGGTYELAHAWLDVENLDAVQTWTAAAAITIDDAGLYDVKQIENPTASTQYMIAYATSTTAVQVRRVSGSIVTSNVWSTLVTTNHADRVLAIHADGGASANDGGVIIVYQGTGAAANDLVGDILDFSDGTAIGTLTVYTGITADFAAVGIARTTLPASPTSTRVAVIAEFQNEDVAAIPLNEEFYAHWIVCQEVAITAFAGLEGNAHVTPNLNMLSKPYSYTDGDGDRHVYCGLGYKTVRTNADWAEFHAFICDMGLQHWSRTANTVRPRPCASYPLLNIDTQPHGSCPEANSRLNSAIDIGRRMNHLSNWVPGPSWLCDTRKSRTVVWPGWRMLTSTVADVSLAQGTTEGPRPEPAGATIEEITHVLEDPWTANRDDLDYTQPTSNFHGANPLSLYATAEVQGQLLVAGGTPHLYDGTAIVEMGFPWVPEIVDVQDTGVLGTIQAGVYRYVAVYEWTDTQGQLHRSGTGTPYIFEATGGEGATITVRTMTIGSKEAAWLYPNAAAIVIAIYRSGVDTGPGADNFYRMHATDVTGFTPQDIPLNDPTEWAIEVADDLNDLGLLQAPTLVFPDSELTPETPPAAHAVANWQNRAWLASSEEKELWYSKENLPTAATGRIAPEFSSTLRYLLDVVRGEVTSLIPLDDSLVIFTREGIYLLAGDGPNALGQGASYQLQVVHEGTGCIEPRSVTSVPSGIIFQSYKGLYLLSKDLQLDHISTGAPIDDLIRAAGNVRSGNHLEDRHTVAFVANSAVTDAPQVIKWDYYHRMWSTAEIEPPNTTAWLSSTASGCVWRGNERDVNHVTLCQGNLLIERGRDDSTPYRDESDAGGSVAVRMDIETGWISLAGIAGYKRVREIGIQTELVGSADDFDAELDIDATGAFSTASPELHPFPNAPAYIRLRPLTPKMSSFRLRLSEPDGIAVGENRKINGITVHVGRKKGPRKVPDSQQR